MNKIDVEKGFLENLDYLKQLVKLINSKPMSSFDQNLTYEVIYAEAYVESIIPQIEDTKLVATLGDIKTALDLVVSEIPIDEVNRQKKSKDYENLVKLKYSDSSRGSYEEDVPYESASSPIKFYLSNRLPFIILLVVITVIILSGGVSTIVDLLPKPTGENVEAFNSVFSLTSMILSLCFTLIILVGGLGLTLDLMYICLPFVREMLDRDGHNRMYSIYAKSAVEAYDNQLVHFKRVKNYDRIKRNFYWMESMISHMEVMDLNKEQAVLYKQLIDLKANFDGSIKHNTTEYYRQVAKIEFLHNKYLSLIEGVVKNLVSTTRYIKMYLVVYFEKKGRYINECF